jgi:glyoxylase-like metal-dependent hydrolase (beta-lactamase superfamily II)
MTTPTILTIDLNFQNIPGTIGAYLLPHRDGAILVETGPGSTIPQLIQGLAQYGYAPNNITDVFLTHIHLDHAGAAGWLAKQGARIHVHPKGANHLVNPDKLLASAARVYGAEMEILWGQFFSVPEEIINILTDNSLVNVGELTIQAVDVPGHADHHLAFLVEGACFTGDVGGIRVHGQKYISLPMPPPELHLEKWRTSIHKLIALHPQQIIPTHFGIYPDADWHLNTLLHLLDNIDQWIEATMHHNPSMEELRKEFIQFEDDRARQAGQKELTMEAQQMANPSKMSADGIFRFWLKYRQPFSIGC